MDLFTLPIIHIYPQDFQLFTIHPQAFLTEEWNMNEPRYGTLERAVTTMIRGRNHSRYCGSERKHQSVGRMMNSGVNG